MLGDTESKYAIAVTINKILNNTISYAGSNDAFHCGPGKPAFNCDPTTSHDLGEGILVYDDSNYNLIEGNDLSYAGHNLMQVRRANHNIVRANDFHNNWERNLYFIGENNLFEDNIVRDSAPSSDSAAPVGMVVSGTGNIVRRNLYYDNAGTPLLAAVKKNRIPKKQPT